MRRYPESLVKQARRLVAGGMSCASVSRTIDVPNPTVSVWCRDVAKSKYLGLIRANENKRNDYLSSEEFVVKTSLLDNNSAKLWCGLIYGCEGAKYPASNIVSFVNSDPLLVVAFVRLLRKGFRLNEEKFRVHLQIHNDQDFGQLAGYWSKLLEVPETRFYKPTITKPRGRKHRNDYKGTCSLRYGDFKIQLKLIGIFREFLREYGG